MGSPQRIIDAVGDAERFRAWMVPFQCDHQGYKLVR